MNMIPNFRDNRCRQDGFALMIQLGTVMGGAGQGGWGVEQWVGNIPTTFIQLTGAGSRSGFSVGQYIFKSYN